MLLHQDASSRPDDSHGLTYGIGVGTDESPRAQQRPPEPPRHDGDHVAELRAAQVQTQASNRMLRAYQLGEAGLSDWLLARRSALESTRLVLQSRFDAATSSAQLKLQTGLLYELTP